MKIIFDAVSEDRRYALSREEIKALLADVPNDIRDDIRVIRFCCNSRTTQEARIIQRGHRFDIRINFSLKGGESRLLSDNRRYIRQIVRFGGRVDKEKRVILWDAGGEKGYAMFLLLHEVGHLMFSVKISNDGLAGKSSRSEENWCDEYALNKVVCHLTDME